MGINNQRYIDSGRSIIIHINYLISQIGLRLILFTKNNSNYSYILLVAISASFYIR